MNKKYLFGMLLSGAMLAACTADDDFNTASVKQEANPSAPVFAVSFDDGNLQNRAVFNEKDANGNNLWQVGFEKTDLLSLFHGITDPSKDMSGWQNAIYSGEGEDNESFTFKTQSMVNPGYAVLVYPADTGFDNWNTTDNKGKAAPIIRVDSVQTPDTRKMTPYMTEILDIVLDNSTTTDKGKGKAGYGEDYDVTLKRVGSTLSLKLDVTDRPELPTVKSPLAITSVKLRNGDEAAETKVEKGKGVFTTAISVAYSSTTPVARFDNKGKDENHKQWAYVSELDQENVVEGSTTLVTKDVKGDTATFTLLPLKTGTTLNDVNVVVGTNYGKVTLASNSNEKVWKGSTYNSGEITTNVEQAISSGLNQAYRFTWLPARTGTFSNKYNLSGKEGEKVGAHINATLKVDLSELDMNGLHITDQDHLKDAIEVYNALSADKEIVFILDGNEDKEFVMEYDAWHAMETQLKKADNKLKFQPCVDEDEDCTKIVLKNTTGEAQEVPALTFQTVQVSDGTTGTKALDLVVDLAGEEAEWTYTSTIAGGSTDNAKVISGVAELHVTAGNTLTPSGYLSVKGSDKTKNLTLIIDENATMSIKSGVESQLDVENHGLIDIVKSATLRAIKLTTASGAVITNWAQTPKGDEKPAINGKTRKCGTINNAGTLAAEDIQNANGGRIINHGVINVTGNASTAVTENATDNASFATAYGASNKIGTIYVPNAQGNGKTTVYKNDGFIKFKLDKAEPTIADFGGNSDLCIANYLELGASCTTLKQYSTTTAGQQGLPIGTGSAYKIQYIEVNSEVDFSGTYTVDGVIVNKGQFDITTGGNLTVNTGFHLASYLGVYGTLAGSAGTTRTIAKYYGGDDADVKWFTGENQ